MMQSSARAANTVNANEQRTCCNCCHIKHGTVALGLVELIGVALLLYGIVNKLVWKNDALGCKGEQSHVSRLFQDCLLRNFSHFDWTLAGDYIVALLLTLAFICILLLFLGILKKSPMMLLPHLIVQGICLIFSLVYFIIYAWSYFYGDVYIQKHEFQLQSLLERMWLATLFLILAAFQFYLFFTVIKCCLYLQAQRDVRLMRFRQFEECSKRVRDAKENGLWRNTSWGGGFQQYKGQYDEPNNWQKKRDKPVVHVQWNLQGNTEKSISISITDDSMQEKKPQVVQQKKGKPTNNSTAKADMQIAESKTHAQLTKVKSTESSSKNIGASQSSPKTRAKLERQVSRSSGSSSPERRRKEERERGYSTDEGNDPRRTRRSTSSDQNVPEKKQTNHHRHHHRKHRELSDPNLTERPMSGKTNDNDKKAASSSSKPASQSIPPDKVPTAVVKKISICSTTIHTS